MNEPIDRLSHDDAAQHSDRQADAGTQAPADRRRPGRLDIANPHLIALLRDPTTVNDDGETGAPQAEMDAEAQSKATPHANGAEWLASPDPQPSETPGVAAHLVPGFVSFETADDDLRPAKGIIVGLALAIPFWAVVVYFLFR